MSYALITGASSGIGEKITKVLFEKGYSVIITARRKDMLESLRDSLEKKAAPGQEIHIFQFDLSRTEDCFKLIEKTRNFDIDVLINNAGYGVFGKFTDADLDDEISMINVNIKALHILMKTFLADFCKKDRGYILNVASFAGFLPGPLFASYYASKAYVVRYSQAIQYELKKKKSNVSVSVLCPGPVNTGFNNRAGVAFAVNGLDAADVARYAVEKMLKKKKIILPDAFTKIGRFFTKVIPDSALCAVVYLFQKQKEE